jgi:hypothetical protein
MPNPACPARGGGLLVAVLLLQSEFFAGWLVDGETGARSLIFDTFA